MTFKKIKSGIAPFDNLFQGLYLNRPTLLSGKFKSGTTTLALRFLARVLQLGERVLYFTETSPDHITLAAHGLGADIDAATKDEQINLVPYDRHLPLLPFPEALDELRELISERHFAFVIFDSVIPWLAAPAAHLEERLNAFFGLLDESGATSLLILHHPVSPLARRLFDEVSQRCAICLNAIRAVGGVHSLEVSKYMGAPPEKCPQVISLASDTPPDSSQQFSAPKSGMTLQALHKATQRIQVDISSFLNPSSRHGAPAHSSHGGFQVPPPAAPHKPVAPSRRPGEPAIAPLPAAIPLSSLQQAVPPMRPAAQPAAPGAPGATAARRPAPAIRIPREAAVPRPAIAVPPPRRAEPHPIRFSDALPPDDARPQEPARAAAAPVPPPPAPAQPAQEHRIRFSDIIQ